MGKIKGGRVILDENNEPVSAWAILVHGHTNPDLLFSSRTYAEFYQSYTRHLIGCEIVPVVVVGAYVSRV